MWLHEIIQVSLFLSKGGAQIVSSQTVWAVTGIDTWLARQSIHWHRVMSSTIVMKVCRYFKESLHFIAENQIFLKKVFFLNAMVGFFID